MAVFSFFAQFANLSAFAVVFWFDFEHYGKVKVSNTCCAIDEEKVTDEVVCVVCCF